MTGVRVEGTDRFVAAAQALNDAGDKDLRKQVYAAFRKAAKPLGQRILASGSATLPVRGGLRARVAAASVGVSNSTTGRNPGVSIRLKTREGYDLGGMDRGQLRHPVFARQGAARVWVRQSVPAGSFSAAFDAGAPSVKDEVLQALNDVVDEIARKTEGHS